MTFSVGGTGGILLGAALALFGCRLGRGTAGSVETRSVGHFDLSGATCGGAHAVIRTATGFSTWPQSALVFVADGRVSAFDARVGINAASTNAPHAYGQPTARCRVWADGRIVADTHDVVFGQEPVPIHANLEGAHEIILETTDGAPWTNYVVAETDWLEATFTLSPGARLAPDNTRARFAELGILTPAEPRTPRINGADTWGVRPGHSVLFRVATSGARPMVFSAKGLPDGVSLDEKGVLRGTAGAAGDYPIEVTARNAFGTAVRVVHLVVGDTIALTPPMGWNSWNTLCYRLTEEKAMAAARALEASGLADHGYTYVNLDDWWAMNNSGCPRVEERKRDFGGREDVIGPARDAEGRILPNRSFPDMKALTDLIHSFGFKAGIYSSPGRETCGKCEGSYGHERADAARWAEWGFDYVKYDWCSYADIFRRETGLKCTGKIDGTGEGAKVLAAYQKPYRLMGEALREQPRDIVFSFCQYGMAGVEKWGAAFGGNTFRSSGDLKDGWSWFESCVEGERKGDYAPFARPGWWCDPDMLVVGEQYSFGSDHPTYLTPNEQYTHVSLWAMMGAPLFIGCDLAKLDAFTRGLLANDEVIAVDQDRLGKTARRIRHLDAESVWTRPLADNFTAVALVNRSPVAREIKVSFAELGLKGECWVKDLWRQECEGRHAGTYVARVPAHATKLVKIRPVDCPKCPD